MINSFSFKYNYLGIIQQYFQPKIGRKKKQYSAWARKTIFLLKRKRVYQTEEDLSLISCLKVNKG